MADSPPLKGASFLLGFPFYDATGALIKGAAGLAACVSTMSGSVACNFGAVTCTVVELGASMGFYVLPLASNEMNGDVIAWKAISSTASAKEAVGVIYTVARQLKDLAFPTTSGTGIQVNSSSQITISSIATSA